MIELFTFGEEGDEFGGDFDGEGQEAIELHEQPALAAAPGFQEAAFVAVHRAADYTDAVTVHRGGDFLGGIVAYIAVLAGGMDEARHLGGAHREGNAVAVAAMNGRRGGRGWRERSHVCVCPTGRQCV